MAQKIKSIYVCDNCGFETAKWLGKCPSCNEWNSFYEEKAVITSNSSKDKCKTKSEVIQL